LLPCKRTPPARTGIGHPRSLDLRSACAAVPHALTKLDDVGQLHRAFSPSEHGLLAVDFTECVQLGPPGGGFAGWTHSVGDSPSALTFSVCGDSLRPRAGPASSADFAGLGDKGLPLWHLPNAHRFRKQEYVARLLLFPRASEEGDLDDDAGVVLDASHLCHNRRCVNVQHLDSQTPSVNRRDNQASKKRRLEAAPPEVEVDEGQEELLESQASVDCSSELFF
jgi:hypothetical protein